MTTAKSIEHIVAVVLAAFTVVFMFWYTEQVERRKDRGS